MSIVNLILFLLARYYHLFVFRVTQYSCMLKLFIWPSHIISLRFCNRFSVHIQQQGCNGQCLGFKVRTISSFLEYLSLLVKTQKYSLI